jgi:hypothetical protein
MSKRKPEAEKKLGLFFSPSGAAGDGGYMIPMGNLNVGPGEPGPGDEWHMPAEPSDGINAADEAGGESVPSAGPVTPTPAPTRKP